MSQAHEMSPITGAKAIIDVLRLNGSDLIFTVPGESFLPVIDALYDVQDDIRLITCRHEAAAANMAEAYGKLTGKPGICFVTRGPGATHASIGVHTAFQAGVPMILFVGQISRGDMERDAFQEIDYRQMFGPMAKWVAQIDDAKRVPEMVSRAFHVALSGQPGPVVLALPEDMLHEPCNWPAGLLAASVPCNEPRAADMATFAEMLERSKQPLLIVGGSGWDEASCATMRDFAEGSSLPVAAAFRCQDYFDNRHELYVGHIGLGLSPALAKRVEDADLIIALGTRLDDVTSGGYTVLQVPKPHQALIHIFPDPNELGRVYQANLAVCTTVTAFVGALGGVSGVSASSDRRAWAEAGRAAYLKTLEPPAVTAKVDFGTIMAKADLYLPADTIVANGAGNYTTWIHRYYQYPRLHSQLAPNNGAMGYGLPAAIAAALICPDRLVVSFAGDGCFLMNCQELATAVHHKLPMVFVVVNNNSYGTIRMYQERLHPGRVHGTDLTNPNFVALAQAFGMSGELVTETDSFWPAFERARQTRGPALIELRLDLETISAGSTLSAIREAAAKPA